MDRVLIVDFRTDAAVEVCRAMGRRGRSVDVLADPKAPALRSKFCARRFIAPSPPGQRRWLDSLRTVLEVTDYEAIYVCADESFEALQPLVGAGLLKSLPLPPSESLYAVLSKNAMIRLAADAGLRVPRTLVPDNEADLELLARELGFPLVVKGDRGTAGTNVRMVRCLGDLSATYARITRRQPYGAGPPALQKLIPGDPYLVGALAGNGKPLRVCVHRKVLTCPKWGGITVKAVTEHVPGILDQAFRMFETLRYSGLGQLDFVRDRRDGKMYFLEINPRVWGSIGIALHAGVDFYTPYCDLARGESVEANLEFRDGVSYAMLNQYRRLGLYRPSVFIRFLSDCFNREGHSDFDWDDPWPHLPTIAPIAHKIAGRAAARADGPHRKRCRSELPVARQRRDGSPS